MGQQWKQHLDQILIKHLGQRGNSWDKNKRTARKHFLPTVQRRSESINEPTVETLDDSIPVFHVDRYGRKLGG